MGTMAEEAADASRTVVGEERIKTIAQVKISTCSTLAEDALLGEAQSATELTEMLCDSAAEVRSAAMEALLGVAQCGPQHVVDITSDHIALADLGLRWRSHEHSVVSA